MRQEGASTAQDGTPQHSTAQGFIAGTCWHGCNSNTVFDRLRSIFSLQHEPAYVVTKARPVVPAFTSLAWFKPQSERPMYRAKPAHGGGETQSKLNTAMGITQHAQPALMLIIQQLPEPVTATSCVFQLYPQRLPSIAACIACVGSVVMPLHSRMGQCKLLQ